MVPTRDMLIITCNYYYCNPLIQCNYEHNLSLEEGIQLSLDTYINLRARVLSK